MAYACHPFIYCVKTSVLWMQTYAFINPIFYIQNKLNCGEDDRYKGRQRLEFDMRMISSKKSSLSAASRYGLNVELWHFGHGGSVSVASSRYKLFPHFLQVYVPLPGFSPVVDIVSPPEIKFNATYFLCFVGSTSL